MSIWFLSLDQAPVVDGITVKRILTLILAPLFAAVVAAACVELWRRYGNQLEAGLFEQVIIAGVGFSVALVFANHIFLWFASSKTSKLHSGVTGYERDIRKRIQALSDTSAKFSDLTDLMTRLDALEANTITGNQASETNPPFRLGVASNVVDFDDPVAYDAAINPNVIRLDPSKRAANQKSEGTPTVPAQGVLSDLVADGRLKMYLQPVVSLPDRGVPGYEALARLELEEGHIIPAAEFLPKAEATNTICEIDQEVLGQAIALLRALRRKKQDAEIFWNISPASLQSKSAFSPIKDILAASEALAPLLTVEISKNSFFELGKKQINRLSTLRDMGFKLSLDQCTSLKAAEEISDTGLFSYVKVPVSTLEQYTESETENVAGQLSKLFHDTSVRIVATHIERENQVMQLIDNDIYLAQGYLFSAARPPKIDTGASGISDAG